MVAAVAEEERPSAKPGKWHKLPILTRSTLWFVMLFCTPTLVGIVAGFLIPVAMNRRIPPMVETNFIMSSLGLAVGAYRQEYGQLPSSENRDLVKELTGQNAKDTPFMMFRRRSLNSLGEAVDSWGTPLRFAWPDGRSAQIISAGPDRTFGTADDIQWPNGR